MSPAQIVPALPQVSVPPFPELATERANFSRFARSGSVVSQKPTLPVAFSANDGADNRNSVCSQCTSSSVVEIKRDRLFVMIKDRPAHLLGQNDYKRLPSEPFAVDFAALPDLIRESFAPLGGIQPVTGAMATAANGQL